MCNKSDSIAKIAQALVSFHSEIRSISHDEVNPHFKSKYTTLDHMIDHTKPILAKHGLTIIQFPGGDAEKVTIRTMICHVSGEWIESEPLTLKPVKLDPQGAGSAITYGRRYSYAAALSLSLGDDDDGNAASMPPTQTSQSVGQQRLAEEKAKQNTQATNTETASPAQVNYMYKLKKDKQISDEAFKQIVQEHAEGKDLKTVSKKEASDLISVLNAYTPIPEGALPF
jgi:hypothetical protein